MDYKNLSPLCVDLDGTLIYEDVIWVLWRRLIKDSPLSILKPFKWLLKGRAYFKQQLALKSTIDPSKLTYNQDFLDFLKECKKKHVIIYLATAADHHVAKIIADYIGLFDDVIASTGTVNLRARKKALFLVSQFGHKGFSYAGNSYDDLSVWPYAKQAIAVNLSFKARLFLKFSRSSFYLWF